MEHPSDEILKRFAAGTASLEESRLVVAHLLKGCGLCSRKLKGFLEPDLVAAPSYDNALERFDRRLIEALEELVSPSAPLAAPPPRRPCEPLPDRRGNSSGPASGRPRARKPEEFP
jgi:hypothetical protein